MSEVESDTPANDAVADGLPKGALATRINLHDWLQLRFGQITMELRAMGVEAVIGSVYRVGNAEQDCHVIVSKNHQSGRALMKALGDNTLEQLKGMGAPDLGLPPKPGLIIPGGGR